MSPLQTNSKLKQMKFCLIYLLIGIAVSKLFQKSITNQIYLSMKKLMTLNLKNPISRLQQVFELQIHYILIITSPSLCDI